MVNGKWLMGNGKIGKWENGQKFNRLYIIVVFIIMRDEGHFGCAQCRLGEARGEPIQGNAISN
jgi:hypothetical protein